MVGMMHENGPFTIHTRGGGPGYDLVENPFSWNEEAHVIFLEQPIRTGFSLAKKGARSIRTEGMVSQDFYLFMVNFLTVFDEFHGAPFFISGESYAGEYIPNMAQYIVEKQRTYLGGIHINLQGIAIGNGAIDTLQEYSYTEYAYSHGLIPLGAKKAIDKASAKCLAQAAKKGGKAKRENLSQCDVMGQVLEAAGKPNEYDTSTFNSYDHIIQPNGVFHAFFNDADVQTALHVRGLNLPGLDFTPEQKSGNGDGGSEPIFYAPESWEVCNDKINDDFGDDRPVSAVPALQFLAANKVRVLLYSGEHDLNCNTLGTLHVLEANTWLDQEWSSAKRFLWRYGGDVAGEYFTIDSKMSFLIVRNSGHLLPMDVPSTALEMINKFSDNKPFDDLVELPNEASYAASSEPVLALSFNTSISFATRLLGICFFFAFICASLYAIAMFKQRNLSFGLQQLTPPRTTMPLVAVDVNHHNGNFDDAAEPQHFPFSYQAIPQQQQQNKDYSRRPV